MNKTAQERVASRIRRAARVAAYRNTIAANVAQQRSHIATLSNLALRNAIREQVAKAEFHRLSMYASRARFA